MDIVISVNWLIKGIDTNPQEFMQGLEDLVVRYIELHEAQVSGTMEWRPVDEAIDLEA